QVIQLYPQSRLVAFVYLVYAEDLYATKRYDLAERYYKKVAQFRDSEAYAYALFQLGHCKMQPLGSNQPEYKEALRYYHQAIQATMFGTGGGPKNLAVRLRRQARLALVPAFVNIGKPSKAHAFLAKLGRGPQTEDETVAMMEALARSYLDAGMVVESTYIYKQLLSRHNQHPDACGWASQIYDNAHRLGSKSLIEGEGREVRNFAQEPNRRDDPQCARLVDEPM
ncbi:MAG: tetratricopeptide repeat protein, partial [Nannocystaceae bacterium]